MASSGGGDEVEVNLTPLLDLVLQLIMFFMITIRLVAYEQSNEDIALPAVSLSLPQDDEAKARKFPVWVNIDYKGQILGLGAETLAIPLKGDPIPVPDPDKKVDPEEEEKAKKGFAARRKELQDKIKNFLDEKKISFGRQAQAMGMKEWKVGVIIRADRRCRYEYVWTVMEIVQDANFDFWQISIMNLAD